MGVTRIRTLGVIGGLGPKATANFYMEVIIRYHRINREQRPPILIYNVPIAYQIEKEFLESGNRKAEYLSYLIEAAKILKEAGVDLLAIPCNTVHLFFPQIVKIVNIPVFNIVDEVTKVLIKKGYKRVGLLATSKTLNEGFYTATLNRYQIEHIIPNCFEE